MRKKLFYLFLSSVILVLVLFPIVVIKWNSIPLFTQPGFFVRIKTYLTTNIAETQTNSIFPELEITVIKSPPEKLWKTVKYSVQQLKWEIREINEVQMELNAVISTPLFQFKDDIFIRVNVIESDKCSLYIRSSSRVGKGDFGKNTEHILLLLDQINTLISQ